MVEYEPDTDFRDTEQIPLLHEGGIDAFLAEGGPALRARRLVFNRAISEGRVRDQLHPALLQAKAHEERWRRYGPTSGLGRGNRGPAGGDSGEMSSMLTEHGASRDIPATNPQAPSGQAIFRNTGGRIG